MGATRDVTLSAQHTVLYICIYLDLGNRPTHATAWQLVKSVSILIPHQVELIINVKLVSKPSSLFTVRLADAPAVLRLSFA